jgi:hypothetical protein
MVLVSTESSWDSTWVKEECETFYNECSIKSNRKRRIILFQEQNIDLERLPPLLRKLRICDQSKN